MLLSSPSLPLVRNAGPELPAWYCPTPAAARRFLEFFATQIRNRHTRKAYWHAAEELCAWCERQGLTLSTLDPLHMAWYVELLAAKLSIPSVKLHLAGLRMLFDWLVTGGVLPYNPAASVRGPRYSISRGKTPVLSPQETRLLLDSLNGTRLADLRDRAIIAVMVYSFARVGAVVGMRVEDFRREAGRNRLRFFEKNSKVHDVPAHPEAARAIQAWIDAVGIAAAPRSPLFRALPADGTLSENGLHPNDIGRMVKRRAAKINLSEDICCHSFRATGITAYLSSGGTLEKAQAMAGHASPRTTKLYDRTPDTISAEEIERIRF